MESVKAVVESLGDGLAGLNVFMKNWMGVLTQPDGVFPSDQVFTLTSCTEKAASYLAGMYAAIAMIEQEEKKDAGHQD